MVRVRMTRKGTTKKSFFRIVVADERSPRDGRFLEQIGWYDPVPNPPKVRLNLDRYKHWVGVGAQPTETVAQIVKRHVKALAAAAAAK
ncbi:MAG: 30S ribosomal protein S16 [Deltaproteobacteria bacterium]|nr:30S ribosomal protein S16 [Deltaproteobacteria bacterium]